MSVTVMYKNLIEQQTLNCWYDQGQPHVTIQDTVRTLLKVSVSQKNTARVNKTPISTLPERYSIYMVNPAASAIPLKYFGPEYTMKGGYPRD